jgi:tRNA G37 N-methylase Trm5
MDFILTMYAEAKFNPKAISATKDWGLCQFHIPVHGDRRWDSIEKQVDDCRNKRKLVPVKWKYRFAYDHRNTYKDKFYTE